MRAGMIGETVSGSGTIDSFELTNEIGDESLTACVEVLSTQQGKNTNSRIQTGRAAIEEYTKQSRTEINNGTIVQNEADEINTRYTEFIILEGQFCAVQNSSGTFLFDLISRSEYGMEIEEAEFNLDGFLNGHNTVPWHVGFYGHTSDAEKGSLYGSDIFTDRDFGAVVESCAKNQLGVTIDTDAQEVKMTLTESGYAEVYQPSNYESSEFAELIEEHLLPHAK